MWTQVDADNAENVMLRTGCAITHAGCPLLWLSKLQTEISLSTTEAEYIALIQTMRKVIPSMAFMKEVSFIFYIHLPKPEVFCKVFEYNQRLFMLRSPKHYHQEKYEVSSFPNLRTKEYYSDILY